MSAGRSPPVRRRAPVRTLVGLLGGTVLVVAPVGMVRAAQPGQPLRTEVVTVFVLAGQSNLAGRAPASELPPAMRVPPARVQLDHVCSFGASDLLKPEDYPKDGGPPEPHRSNGWVPLQPSRRHLSTPEAHFGPEIGFGHALARRWPERRIALVKHGRGATSLAEDWAPDAASGRRLYADMLAQVQRCLADLRASGATVELGGFVWCQGEADTTRREWAEAYERNLTAFFARVRRDLAAPELPILFALTGEGRQNPKMLFPPAVRRAQQSVAARDPRAALVSGDDLSLLDHVHYGAAGQLTLGRRLAEACLAMETIRR